jgi:hypothetical protein
MEVPGFYCGSGNLQYVQGFVLTWWKVHIHTEKKQYMSESEHEIQAYKYKGLIKFILRHI